MELTDLLNQVSQYGPEIAAAVVTAVISEVWAGYSKRFPKYTGVTKRIINLILKGLVKK